MERLTKRCKNGNVTLDASAFTETQETIDREIRNFAPAQAAVERLAEFEDAEEKGLNLHLHCNIGDTVYIADNWKNEVSEFRVNKIAIFKKDRAFYYQNDLEQPIVPDLWGKTAFLTPEAAQQALKESENK